MSHTIVITGGHHNSALVVARELVKRGHHVEWLGHRYAARGDRHDSAEYSEVKAAGIPFHELKAGKLSRIPRPSELVTVPLGLIRAWRYLRQIKPAAILSFGGYLGLATALAGHLLKIPIYLHEQTLVAGKANRSIGKLAQRIYLTWQQSARFFPLHKTQVVGLPLRAGLLTSRAKKLFEHNLPTILVLGGKQGSQIINRHIFQALPELLKHYNLIHQTGTSSVTGDYERAVAQRESMSSEYASHYLPVGYIGEDDIGSYLAAAQLVVGRSGAHTAYELGLLGKPAVLIPFMHTTGHEQLQQARFLESAGLATILPESRLTTPALIALIQEWITKKATTRLALPTDAADRLTTDLLSDLK